MPTPLTGKRVLVTGGSRGIGLACARELARAGCQVTLLARREDALDAALHSLDGSGHVRIAADLLVQGAGTAAAAAAQARGPLDIVVHAAGGTLGAREPDAPLGQWESVFRLNLFAAVEINNAILPSMRNRGRGHLLHISSSAAVHGRASTAYSAAKAALNRYVVALGRAEAECGIVAAAVMPAAVAGLGNTWERAARENPGAHERTRENQVGKRFQTPEEIAAFVAFLASEAGRTFAGCVLNADGNLP